MRRAVHFSTHFLENVIDANQYPLTEITELAQWIRRIGLGVMALAHHFIKLGSLPPVLPPPRGRRAAVLRIDEYSTRRVLPVTSQGGRAN